MQGIPEIALSLAANGEPAKAEQLYRRLFGLAETWKANTIDPLIAVTAGYVSFLQNQPARLGEVSAAIEEYRRVLVDANGLDSGTLIMPLQMRIEFAGRYPRWTDGDAAARELLALEGSLTGTGSDAYTDDVKAIAQMRARRGQ